MTESLCQPVEGRSIDDVASHARSSWPDPNHEMVQLSPAIASDGTAPSHIECRTTQGGDDTDRQAVSGCAEPPDESDERIPERLLTLNLERASKSTES